MKNVKNPLIFIVEENQIYKDLITSYLFEKKFRNLKIFTSGNEVLKNTKLKPDVIVIDNSMAGINSFDLMKKVKKLLPGVDFIFLSSQDNVEAAVHHIKMGAFDYIVKDEHAPEKLIRSLNFDISFSRKTNLNNALRKAIIGFFVLLVLFILSVVGLRYLFNL